EDHIGRSHQKITSENHNVQKKDPSRLGRVCIDLWLWVFALYPRLTSNRNYPRFRKYYGYEDGNKAYEYGQKICDNHQDEFTSEYVEAIVSTALGRRRQTPL
ncbi:MAG: hypothetical protein KDD84_20105, partial [Caldilineaceae bacterium]|nr:hypothetical protein [Caldilineaceae bacterium]